MNELDQLQQRVKFLEDIVMSFVYNDRYTFQKNVQILDGRNVQTGKNNGVIIAAETDQKLGFWGETPVTQHSSTGETDGFTANAGTGVTEQSTFTGNVGTKAYRISDVVKAVKNAGIMAKS